MAGHYSYEWHSYQLSLISKSCSAYINFSLPFSFVLSNVSLFNHKSFECRCKSGTHAFDSVIINGDITHWHLCTWIYTLSQNIITAVMQIIIYSRTKWNKSTFWKKISQQLEVLQGPESALTFKLQLNRSSPFLPPLFVLLQPFYFPSLFEVLIIQFFSQSMYKSFEQFPVWNNSFNFYYTYFNFVCYSLKHP